MIEWHERLVLAETVQQRIKEGRLVWALTELRRQGVNHVVWPASEKLPGLERIYADPYYQVFRLKDVWR